MTDNKQPTTRSSPPSNISGTSSLSRATTISQTTGASQSTLASTLLRPFKLGSMELKNSIAMAPMTRSMANDDLVPHPDAPAYYARRANAGLIITEATIIQPNGQGYPNTPGIYSQAQIVGWRKVTDKVHQKSGKIFLQLWHVGRVSHPVYLGGNKPVAPSEVLLDGTVARKGDLKFEMPRSLKTEEIPQYVTAYAEAATNAMTAGFDGVEIHGANGYLVDQFLHYATNKRNDKYGGSHEKMSRFALEVVDAVCERVDPQRVGIRLSPGGYLNDIKPHDDDPVVFRYLLKKLEQCRLAYVHIGIFDDGTQFKNLDGSASAFLRRNYNGTLIGNGSYSLETAATALAENAFDLVSMGRPFIANPDLIEKLQAGETMAEYDPSMLKRLY